MNGCLSSSSPVAADLSKPSSACLTAALLVTRRLTLDLRTVEGALRAGDAHRAGTMAVRGPFGPAIQRFIQSTQGTEREIAEHLAPILWARGLLIVGLDVIGGHLTEINVTSPTCMVEIAGEQGFDVAALVIDKLEQACA